MQEHGERNCLLPDPHLRTCYRILPDSGGVQCGHSLRTNERCSHVCPDKPRTGQSKSFEHYIQVFEPSLLLSSAVLSDCLWNMEL